MLFRLVILNGPMCGHRVTVPEEPLTIGRAPGCGLVLDDAEAACEHCEMDMDRGDLRFRDLGSMSGTLVNQVEQRKGRLKHGDVIEMGRTRLLVEAHVQAEIPVGKAQHSTRRFRRPAAVLLAVCLAAAGAWYGRRPARRDTVYAQPAASPAETTADAEAGPAESPAALPEPQTEVATVDPTALLPEQPGLRLDEELHSMRNDIEAIRDTLSALSGERAAWIEAAPAVAEPGETTSGPDPAHALLERAREEIDAGRWVEADRLLAGLQVLAPDFLPAWEQRARLLEDRGQFKRAEAEWSHIASVAAESEDRERADREVARLAQRQWELEAETASVQIASLSQRKFPELEGIREMRTVTVSLVPEEPHMRPDPESVGVEIVFFDRKPADGSVFPSRRVPPVHLQPEGEWEPGAHVSLVATYRIDDLDFEGFFFPSAQPNITFFGYRVRLFVRGELASEVFRPVTLADLPGASEASAHLVEP